MKHTERFLKQRKFMMMLPVLVLPFVTLMFWALGGGKGSQVQAMPISEGLNAKLPDAQFEAEREEDLWDKFSLYETAARDSAAYETARENDPYFDLIAFESKQGKPKDADDSKLIGTFKRKDRLIDPNEAKVNSKLEELYQEINRASDSESLRDPETQDIVTPETHAEIASLERMMEDINEEGTDADPEMKDINTMLEKLMDVQHPERVRERMNASKSTTQSKTYRVTTVDAERDRNAFHLETKSSKANEANPDSSSRVVDDNVFYDLDDVSTSASKSSNTIAAIVHETQVIVAGATIRLRLLNDVTINNQVVPKDNFIYGTCAISGERLMIEITTIMVDQVLIPVALSVFDLTGLEGIYIPGAISRDAAKQAGDDAINNIQLSSFDQSLEAQAASAGIEATKGLLSKKTKLIKVTVKAGHQVFLKNKDTQ